MNSEKKPAAERRAQIAAVKEAVSEIVPAGCILEEEPMADHTSFRIGGGADLFITVNNEEELGAVLRELTELGEEHMLIGNGSNLLFSDDGYRGTIVKLGGTFEDIICSGDTITAGAARLLSGASSFACENSLAGLEFASGIPGSVGGAVFMNAGAYGGEMKDIVTSVRLMTPDGREIFTRSGDEMDFGYRHSAVQDDGSIVLSAVMKLERGDRDEIAARIKELTEKRNSRQPVNFPSAGSTFKRPVGGYAAALIEQSGLKGTSVGGAEVSQKHSGFIINKGGATCSDVLELMRLVRKKVFEDSGIRLEPEVRIIGGSLD